MTRAVLRLSLALALLLAACPVAADTVEYEVQRGETLYRILVNNGHTPESAKRQIVVMSQDPGTYGISSGNVNKIKPGQRIFIPLPGESLDAAERPAPTPPETPPAQPPPQLTATEVPAPSRWLDTLWTDARSGNPLAAMLFIVPVVGLAMYIRYHQSIRSGES